MPSEAHCQADRGINAEFSRKILDRSVTILLDKNKYSCNIIVQCDIIKEIRKRESQWEVTTMNSKRK